MKTPLIILIFITCSSYVLGFTNTIIKEKFDDFDYTNNPSWSLPEGVSFAYIINGEFISNGDPTDSRRRTLLTYEFPIQSICDVSFEYSGYLINPGNPFEGSTIIMFLVDTNSQWRYDLRMFSGSRYIDSFPINHATISLGHNTPLSMYDDITTPYAPSFNKYYHLKASRVAGQWSFHIDDTIIGIDNSDKVCDNINMIGFWLQGSVKIDNITVTVLDEETNENTNLNLLKKYSPVLHLTPLEKYRPMQVDSIIKKGNLVEDDSIIQFPSYIDLKNAGDSSSIDLPFVDIDTKYDFAPPEYFSAYNLTVYGRVVKNEENYTSLQYYFFYPFNNWFNRHEGDWEMIQVILDDEGEVLSVSNNVHMFVLESKPKNTIRWADETHPIVLIGEGSHASYLDRIGDDEQIRLYIKLANDLLSLEKISKDGRTHSEKSTDPEGYELVEIDDSTEWIDFAGYWGEMPEKILGYKKDIMDYFGSAAPKGPKFMKYMYLWDRWNDPFSPAVMHPNIKRLLGFLKSPADIHIYDSAGKHMGATSLGIDEEIPGINFYTGPDNEPEAFSIAGEDNYTVKIVGRDAGVFTFDLFYFDPEEGDISLTYRNVSILKNSMGIVEINSETYFRMDMDYDGDGITDYYILPEEILTERGYQYKLPDEDSDGKDDYADNCITLPNPMQEDWDANGAGDACDNPRYYKTLALEYLNTIQAKDQREKAKIFIAREHIRKSLDSDQWESDFVPKNVHVLNNERAAVQQLLLFSPKRRICSVSSEVLPAVENLLKADEIIVRRALSTYTGKGRAAIEAEYSKAMKQMENGEYRKSIDSLIRAWLMLSEN